MSVIVAHDSGDGWDDGDVTQIDEYGPRAVRHRNLLRCTLLVHQCSDWSDAERALWAVTVGPGDRSVKSLLHAIRASGISLDRDPA